METINKYHIAAAILAYNNYHGKHGFFDRVKHLNWLYAGTKRLQTEKTIYIHFVEVYARHATAKDYETIKNSTEKDFLIAFSDLIQDVLNVSICGI